MAAIIRQIVNPEPDFFDLYLEFTKNTESPTLYHRWSMISCLSALLGRQVWLPFGEFRIFPNQYIMLIGDPGARKSTAIKLARKILSKTGYKNFSAEKTTKEKFLLDLEGLEEASDSEVTATAVMQSMGLGDLNANEPKEVFIVADEFNDFMRCVDTEFHSMLGALWDYDDESTCYKQRLKNSKSISIYQPTINILGGNTHTGFADMFPPASIGQGFLSRLLLIFAEPSGKKIAFPEPADPTLSLQLVNHLERIQKTIKGPMSMSREAKDALQTIYHSYKGISDMRFTAFATRRYTHLWKICILCAASRLSMQVGIADVLYANTILAYAEHFMPRALGEFGKSKDADVSGKIIRFLELAGTKPQNWQDIYKQVQTDIAQVDLLHKMLEGLVQAGKIQVVRGDRGQAYLPIRRALSNQDLYVDWNLLREYKLVGLGKGV